MAIENVAIPRDGVTIGGILAVPQGRGPFPGVVMIPTIKALDDFAAYVVERLAAEGLVALGVNIFDHPGVPEDPFKRPGAQPDEQVLRDLDAAFAVLKNHSLVKGQPIFAWGYCLGGRFALLWPTYRAEVAGAASFHGFPTNDTTNPNTPTEPAGRVEHLRVPVIACFGEVDRLVPMKEVDRYRSEVERHAKDVEIHTYPGADHGWTNPKAPNYNRDAAEDCWRRAVEFLRRRTEAKSRVA
jgi:carboxymethylenebutenolidase